jgi:predicted nucleic acid-binding protein
MSLISGEKYLLDTNILVYSVNREAPEHVRVEELIKKGLHAGSSFVVAHQNLLEFIAVLTRAYGIAPPRALSDAHAFASVFEVISPLPTTFQTFTQLVQKIKRPSYPFDAYLAATMFDNAVRRIITNNAKDFQPFGLDEIIVP